MDAMFLSFLVFFLPSFSGIFCDTYIYTSLTDNFIITSGHSAVTSDQETMLSPISTCRHNHLKFCDPPSFLTALSFHSISSMSGEILVLRSTDDRTFNIPFKKDATVAAIKAAVAKREQTPVDCIRIQHLGSKLEDNQTLARYDIFPGANLNFVVVHDEQEMTDPIQVKDAQTGLQLEEKAVQTEADGKSQSSAELRMTPALNKILQQVLPMVEQAVLSNLMSQSFVGFVHFAPPSFIVPSVPHLRPPASSRRILSPLGR
jgi:hypothetical protein